jgi:hypothetical protein
MSILDEENRKADEEAEKAKGMQQQGLESSVKKSSMKTKDMKLLSACQPQSSTKCQEQQGKRKCTTLFPASPTQLSNSALQKAATTGPARNAPSEAVKRKSCAASPVMATDQINRKGRPDRTPLDLPPRLTDTGTTVVIREPLRDEAETVDLNPCTPA